MMHGHKNLKLKKYVILIDFQLRQWQHERASVLRRKYTARIFNLNIVSTEF